jgi:hypothetical protein
VRAAREVGGVDAAVLGDVVDAIAKLVCEASVNPMSDAVTTIPFTSGM